MATDVPRGLAAAARAILDRGPLRHRLGRGAPPVSAAGGSGDNTRRVFRLAVGIAGRAWHVARLRIGWRVPPRTELPPGLPRRRLGLRQRRECVSDRACRAWGFVGFGAELAIDGTGRPSRGRRLRAGGERAVSRT